MRRNKDEMVSWELGFEVERLKKPHPIGIYLLERLGQLLDHDAGPDESIEGDASCLCSGLSAAKSRRDRGSVRGSAFKHVFPGGRYN